MCVCYIIARVSQESRVPHAHSQYRDLKAEMFCAVLTNASNWMGGGVGGDTGRGLGHVCMRKSRSHHFDDSDWQFRDVDQSREKFAISQIAGFVHYLYVCW